MKICSVVTLNECNEKKKLSLFQLYLLQSAMFARLLIVLVCPESSGDCGSPKHLVAINEKTHFYPARPVLILMKQCRKLVPSDATKSNSKFGLTFNKIAYDLK